MRLPFQLLSLAVAILIPSVESNSSKRGPIGALSNIQNATIHTQSRRVTALTHFDLSFIIRDDLHVKFNLEPNHDILAEDATVTYLAPDGSISRSETVDRLGHKVYKGKASVRRPKRGQDEWHEVGWARVLVRRDGKYPFFEGAFSVDRDSHHIVSSTNYLQIRNALDPEIDQLDINGEEYMVVWRDSDTLSKSEMGLHHDLRRSFDGNIPACQADVLKFNMDPEHPVLRGIPLKDKLPSFGVMDFSHIFDKRQIDSTTGGNSGGVNLKSTIGNPAGCPSTRKVALVGVATDCSYTGTFNSTQSVRENVISQMNTASGVWEGAFNISLGLQNLTISDENCPARPSQNTEWNQGCSNDVTITNRLNWFSAWRGEQGGDNSHWTLLSTCNTGSEVGLAWLGQACVGTASTSNTSISSSPGSGSGSDGSETVSGANVVIRTDGTNEWAIIAHETGHTFGAVHDCYSQTCGDADYVAAQQCCPFSKSTCSADSRYIMNPYTEPGVDSFSPCTIGNICSAIGRNSVNTDCLSDNKDVTTITGKVCGNGIVEPGEECDCGGEDGCSGDPCCDPTTCKFTSGSVCDPSNEDCCTNSCQFMNKGAVCRASTSSCDPQEVCSGSNGNCPPDKTAPNGQKCGDNGLECASGQCTSRDLQCKTVMGSYTQGNDTHACDSEGCTISCASPQFGYGVCYGLQQNFLDGTECGGGGHCQNGQCKGATVGGEVKSWIDDHKAIVIGVSVAVGVLLLFALIGCLRSCWLRRRRRRGMGRKQVPSPPAGGWQGWGVPPPYERQQQMSQQGPQHGWYPPSAMMSGARGGGGGGGGWNAPPPPPPPAYGSSRGNSVRYA